MKKSKESNGRVLIIVRGGAIQGIFSSEKELKVDILDYDNEEFLDDLSAKIEFTFRKDDLYELPMP